MLFLARAYSQRTQQHDSINTTGAAAGAATVADHQQGQPTPAPTSGWLCSGRLLSCCFAHQNNRSGVQRVLHHVDVDQVPRQHRCSAWHRRAASSMHTKRTVSDKSQHFAANVRLIRWLAVSARVLSRAARCPKVQPANAQTLMVTEVLN